MNLKKIKLSEWHDSNIRPPIPKTGTLPTALHSEKVEILLKKAASTKQEEVIKKAAKIKKGNSTPGRSLVGKVTINDIELGD